MPEDLELLEEIVQSLEPGAMSASALMIVHATAGRPDWLKRMAAVNLRNQK